MAPRRLRFPIPAALALLVASCSEDRPRNVLLISIDTLRADHLGSYGFPEDTTPHLDALAREGARFENVFSPVPLTLPAHASLLTGTIPPLHGIHDNLSDGLGEERTTLAELFRGAGFRTGAIVSSFVLDSRFNLDQGFDTYDDEFEEEHKIAFLSERKGDETTRRAGAWLESHRSEPFFLFLHYYDPHDDYAPPPPFDTRFASDPYAGEVAFVDQQVGEVLAKLENLGLSESTLVVVTGDHGEMLEEHGEATHGYFIYENALRVPLILRGQGLGPGVVEQRIGLIDVAPTIASLMGLEFPAPVGGEDLSGWLRGGAPASPRRPHYAESVTPNRYYGLSSLFGIVVDRWKYIETERPELYDLETDPEESRNVIDAHPQVAAGMGSALEEMLAKATAPSGNEAELDEEALRRLASLGYLSGTARSAKSDTEGPRGDPKDWIGFYRRHQALEKLVAEGRYPEAREIAAGLVQEKTDFTAGYLQLGAIALETGALDEALGRFSKAVELEPENKAAHFHLAEALARLDRNEEAIEHFRKVIAIDPGFSDASGRLARILAGEGDTQSALETLRSAVASAPEDLDARVRLGVLLASTGSLAEGERELRSALDFDPDHGEAHLQLGSVLAKLEKLDEAVVHLRRAVETSTSPAEAHHRLGLVLREQGKRAEGLEHLEAAVALEPDAALAQNNLGLALKDFGRLEEARARYEKALELDPELAEAHNNLGSLLASQGRVQEALGHFRSALRTEPGYGEAHNNLGLALRMTGDRNEALAHFRAALEQNPDWPEPMSEVAWILATRPEAALREPEESLRLASRAAELTGNRDPVILDTLAASLAANGEFERAVLVAEQAVNLAASEASGLAPEIRARASLYRERKPFREANRTLAAPRTP
jgi:arylsulfatase A-like enzyme/tetratricopeptide (TPR) repeat protein